MAFTTFQYLFFSTTAQQLLEGDEYLNVTPAGAIYASGNLAGIISHGVGGNSEVDVDGYVAGFDGVSFAINDINNTVRIGAGGRVVAPHVGVLFDSENTGVTDDLLDNAGSISGSLAAALFHGDGNTVFNAGRMSGGVVLELQGGLNDAIHNLATGVMTGKTVIHATGSGHTIANYGQMIGAASAAKAVDLENGGTVDNYGDISGGASALFMGGVSAIFHNHGTLDAAQNSAFESTALNILLANTGDITALDNAVNFHDNVGGTVQIRNWLGAKIGTVSGTGTAINNQTTSALLQNSGTIAGVVRLGGASTLVNKGDMTGDVIFGGASQTIRNSGHISGEILLQAAGDDLIVNYAGGVIDNARGLGIAQTAAGGFLRVVNAGQITGGVISFEQARLTNIGTIIDDVGFGAQAVVVNKGMIDGNISFANTIGNAYVGTGGSVTGTIFGRGSDGRYYGGDGEENFDLTNSSAKYVDGGNGKDTFRFTVAGLTSKVTVLGGGGDDSLTFSNAGAINRTAFTHASGIETINLASGTNSINLFESFVTSATDSTVTINGNAGADSFNLTNFTSAFSKLKLFGAAGKDNISVGSSTDTFIYTAASESTGSGYDIVFGANLSIDKFDVSQATGSFVSAVNAAVTTGALSTATFNTDLAAAIGAGQLGARSAVLFTPNAGGLAFQTFLVVDVNNVAGYQANADLVINLQSYNGTLSINSFV